MDRAQTVGGQFQVEDLASARVWATPLNCIDAWSAPSVRATSGRTPSAERRQSSSST